MAIKGNHWMVLKNLSQVFEAQHSVAIAINEIMAKTLVYIVPETLSAILQVQGWLRSEEERVNVSDRNYPLTHPVFMSSKEFHACHIY